MMTPPAAYLEPTGGNWSACLLSSYAYLRHSWQTQWVGLPKLVEACASFLELRAVPDGSQTRLLLDLALAVARQIESEKGCGIGTDEPHYHNRLHFADSLTTITLQCSLEVKQGAGSETAWQAALLLIAVAHDLQHPGRVNRHTSDIESVSVNALLPLMTSMNLSEIWIERIRNVILRSDFSLVRENHARVAGLPFQWSTDWATVLLNEADIMASASADFGPGLSLALSKEWEAVQFAPHATVATESGRRQFLSNIQFSSYSARTLSVGLLSSD
jgi:hypothetical protein